MWAKDGLVLPDTRNPPVWHTPNDTNDPLAVTLASGIDHFMNVNSNAVAWGPCRYAKDGWWAELAGVLTLPSATDTLLLTLPVAYRRPTGYNKALLAHAGNFGDLVNPAVFTPVTLQLFDNGWVRYFQPSTALPAYMNSLFLDCRYLTNVNGE